MEAAHREALPTTGGLRLPPAQEQPTEEVLRLLRHIEKVRPSQTGLQGTTAVHQHRRQDLQVTAEVLHHITEVHLLHRTTGVHLQVTEEGQAAIAEVAARAEEAEDQADIEDKHDNH